MVCSDDCTIRCQGVQQFQARCSFWSHEFMQKMSVAGDSMPALLSSLAHKSFYLFSLTVQKCWVVPGLFWSETTLSERKPSCCFSNLLKSHSKSAAWARFNQFWLPLLYTNMQNYPSRLWSLKRHISFCFMLLIPVDCENTPVLRLLQTFELTTKQNIESKSYGHGYSTWGQGRCMAKHSVCAPGSLLMLSTAHCCRPWPDVRATAVATDCSQGCAWQRGNQRFLKALLQK